MTRLSHGTASREHDIRHHYAERGIVYRAHIYFAHPRFTIGLFSTPLPRRIDTCHKVFPYPACHEPVSCETTSQSASWWVIISLDTTGICGELVGQRHTRRLNT